jgi:hypothetical protein
MNGVYRPPLSRKMADLKKKKEEEGILFEREISVALELTALRIEWQCVN